MFGYYRSYTLEESIVNFNQKGPFYVNDFEPEIVPGYYKKIVDLVLGQIVSAIKDSNEEIPIVEPKILKLDDLVKRGFCIGVYGQISIPLSV